MMAINNPYQAYQQNQVNTAMPGELTLMLYNGMIKFLKQAKIAVENKDIPESNRLIQRAQDIVVELMVTLNMDYEISKELLPLYDYMKRRLIEANMTKDAAILAEIEEMAVSLRETWSQAVKLAKA
jgi:flagellar protein FliS